jgi:hypothetical protein
VAPDLSRRSQGVGKGGDPAAVSLNATARVTKPGSGGRTCPGFVRMTSVDGTDGVNELTAGTICSFHRHDGGGKWAISEIPV